MAAAGAAVIDLPAFYAECEPGVHPRTMGAVVRVESHGRVLALNVNRLRPQPPQPATADEAVRTAETWIARGYSVDIGLGQINSRNLAALGLTVRAALDPCANLRGSAAILAAGYAGAARLVGEGQAALWMALSAYNTGTYDRGFSNGYVARYAAGYAVPALSRAASVLARNRQGETGIGTTVRAGRANPLTADTAVAWGPGGQDGGED